MEMLSKKQKILAIIGGALLILIAGYYYISSTKDVYEMDSFSENIDKKELEVADETDETIIVHITGAVKNEGIVKVKENSRINDVIDAAGGITEEADLSNVNLAYQIEDGQKIYIPCVKDKEEQKEVITSEAGEKVLTEKEERSEKSKININTATKEKLTELPGIRKFNSFKNYYI